MLVRLYNDVGDALRSERKRLIEREMLLESILTQNPTAITVCRDDGRIVVANPSAEKLFHRGRRLAGRRLAEVLAGCPDAVQQAFASRGEAVFTVKVSDVGALADEESFHLSARRFTINGRGHTLYAVRHLTPELRRQEVAVWKRVIRTISHEMNNTLAPISSLTHSAKMLRQQGRADEKMDDVLDTIGKSVARLKDFIASYARFARLPDPHRREVRWAWFLRELNQVMPVGRATAPSDLIGYFDPAQLQQVFINLITNAQEAESPVEGIEVRVERLTDADTLIQVRDRGCGMTERDRAQALVPFYSTKREGSGLGLALCREIIEAHGGSIHLAARDDGGTVVNVRLPNKP